MNRLRCTVSAKPRSIAIRSAFVLALTLAMGCSTTFTPASAPKRYVGDGGTRQVVDGVELWTFGAPDRPFEIIGWIEDKRRSGVISRATFEGDVTRAAKQAGGDGLILLQRETRLRAILVESTGRDSAYAVPLENRTSRLAVFRYVQ